MSDNGTPATSQTAHSPLTFCVFSFNRAQFLKNCVDSIRATAPFADIWVVDDQSDDPDTRAYLQQIESRCTIIQPGIQGEIKHGGLYHNMQSALERLRDRPLLCFLQDDTQMVRPVGEDEVRQIQKRFDDNPSLGFVHPCFIRGIDLTRRPVTDDPGPDEATFFRRDTGQSAGIHYSDLLIARPGRLLDKGWQFYQSEPENDRQAKALFGPMAYLYAPFAMWLPEVPAWRGKKKTWGLKLAEQKKQCGFYPFRIWDEEQAQAFAQRTEKNLPVAENFLQCDPEDPAKPWTYNPLTGLRWLKHLNNIEVFVRRKLGR